MKYLSVCSGIEAATVAWHHLGWEPVGFSEIEQFPSEVLKYHYPHIPNLGDMNNYKEWNLNEKDVNLLVGGTPCQSFSIAGLRKGIHDERGGLMLTYLEIAKHYRPKFIVWENVVGVLSSNKGRDFGTFLTALGELGYGWAYRVLDAQGFGVPQRRRRVFVVACLGDPILAAKILFESESVCRNLETSKRKRQSIATTPIKGSSGESTGTLKPLAFKVRCGCEGGGKGYLGSEDVAFTLSTTNDQNLFTEILGVYENHPQDSRVKEMGDTCQTVSAKWGTGGGNVPFAIQGNLIGRDKGGPEGIGVSQSDTMYTLTKADVHGVAHDVPIAFNHQSGGDFRPEPKLDLANTIQRCQGQAVYTSMAIRRITPIEAERLQGFPDNYTQIPWKRKNAVDCPDSPRYKSIGNSMAVPVMKWIGERIEKYLVV